MRGANLCAIAAVSLRLGAPSCGLGRGLARDGEERLRAAEAIACAHTAVVTFMWQFTNHDMTFDTSSPLGKPVAAAAKRPHALVRPRLRLRRRAGRLPPAVRPRGLRQVAGGVGQAVRERAAPAGRNRDHRGFEHSTPLWYYVLREAQLIEDGLRLGPVVAEVIVGLLQSDPESYLSYDPRWRPTLPGRDRGDLRMVELPHLRGGRP